MSKRWGILAGGLALLGVAFAHAEAPKKAICPVRGAKFEVKASSPFINVNGKPVYFCCPGCPAAFAKNPEKYLAAAKVDVGKCPVEKGAIKKLDPNLRAIVNNELFYFCCAGCPEAFAKAPQKYVQQLADPVSGKKFKPTAQSPRSTVGKQLFLFQNASCKAAFDEEPAKFTKLSEPKPASR
ncbi:MAG: hypothetical protein HY320_13045 [Armatimonadetes bacterium]|nr:hypothetical protein [Armatimonadota bacterium]